MQHLALRQTKDKTQKSFCKNQPNNIKRLSSWRIFRAVYLFVFSQVRQRAWLIESHKWVTNTIGAIGGEKRCYLLPNVWCVEKCKCMNEFIVHLDRMNRVKQMFMQTYTYSVDATRANVWCVHVNAPTAWPQSSQSTMVLKNTFFLLRMIHGDGGCRYCHSPNTSDKVLFV